MDITEAVAAEGLATFRGCLLNESSAKQLEELLLAALRNGLGYRGKSSKGLGCNSVQHGLGYRCVCM